VVPGAGHSAGASEFGINLTVVGPTPEVALAKLGDTVKFTNTDGTDKVVYSAEGTFVSPTLHTGESYSYVLTKSGTFNYAFRGGYKPEYRGEIIVAKAGEVTLTSAKPAVVWGQTVTLSGTASPTGFPVKIQHRTAASDKKWVDVATLSPAADGTFSAPVKPTMGGDYRATLFGEEIESSLVPVGVRPRLSIRATPRKTMTGKASTVTVTIVPPNATKTLELRRYSTEKAQWLRVAVAPVAIGTGVARFTYKVPTGRSLLRGWLKQTTRARQVTGFNEAYTSNLLITGVAPPPPPQADKAAPKDDSDKKPRKRKKRNKEDG
jgi:plastocyanin